MQTGQASQGVWTACTILLLASILALLVSEAEEAVEAEQEEAQEEEEEKRRGQEMLALVLQESVRRPRTKFKWMLWSKTRLTCTTRPWLLSETNCQNPCLSSPVQFKCHTRCWMCQSQESA